MSTARVDDAPRTLAEELRGRTDAQLAWLFAARPDIAAPPPVDMTQVASRAAGRTSVTWAADRLDTAQLCVLAAMTSLSQPASRDDVVAAVGAAAATDDAVAHLHALALVWGRPDALHVVREAQDLVRSGPPPDGRVEGPPTLATSQVDARRLAHACAGTVLEVVQRVEHLLGSWSERPPTVLRSGGIGVRDLRIAAQDLVVDVEQTEFLVALAQTAQLLGRAEDGRVGEVWAPTTDFDRWRESSIAVRWTRLAGAWLESAGRAVRHTTLEVLATIVPLAYVDAADVVAAVRWHVPRAGEHRDPLVLRTLREASWLGVVALDAVTPAGTALDRADVDAVVSAVDALLPPPIDHVMVQADLTAVAPGPVERDVARRLEEVADVESRGGATVYRFTPQSVRRALDRGWPASSIHAMLTELSTTPVPQPLTYLVDDVARRHGTVRAGEARGYLRSDEPGELDAVLADAALGGLELTRLAPTVAVSRLTGELLVERLRAAGRVAVAEDHDGTLRVDSQRRLRAPVVEVRTRSAGDPDAVVAAVRSGDAAARSRPVGADDARLTRSGSVQTMAALRDAAESKVSVWVAYMDQAGSRTERIVDPMRVDAGWLTAYDHRSASLQRFAIHRITHIAPAPVL